jgi:hypothetical protein
LCPEHVLLLRGNAGEEREGEGEGELHDLCEFDVFFNDFYDFSGTCFVVFFRTCAGAGSTSLVDDARKLQRRGGDRAAPRGPESAAFRSDYLGPRGVPRGGGAVRPCAQGHPKLVGTARREGRFRPPPCVRRRRSEAVRPIDSIAGPRRGHGMRPRSPRPRAKAVRRAARPDDAPRRLSRFDSLVARGPVARFGRKPSRALDFSGDVQGGGSGTP